MDSNVRSARSRRAHRSRIRALGAGSHFRIRLHRRAEGATPPDLPGGNALSPPFPADFSADSDAPVEANGVNPGETLGVRFALLPGAPFADVLDDLGDGSLRIGIHVQALPSGGSESFINTSPVPEPGALAPVCSAGVLLGLARRRMS